jgi:hypothetical protein
MIGPSQKQASEDVCNGHLRAARLHSMLYERDQFESLRRGKISDTGRDFKESSGATEIQNVERLHNACESSYIEMNAQFKTLQMLPISLVSGLISSCSDGLIKV